MKTALVRPDLVGPRSSSSEHFTDPSVLPARPTSRLSPARFSLTRRLVVLALRRADPGAVPDLRARTCCAATSTSHAAAGGVLGRRRRRLAAVRAPVRPQGGDRPGAVRLHRHDRVRRSTCTSPADSRPAPAAGAHPSARPASLIGIFGGFFIVPLYALIQTPQRPGHRSRIIAAQQHPQRAVHGGRRGPRHRRCSTRLHHPAAVPRRRAAERRGGRCTSTRWCPSS